MDDKKTISVRKEDVDYLRFLLGDHISEGHVLATLEDNELKESIDYMKIKEAYAKAHDIRKFEIDLYWKRANYFWLFMTALAGLVGFSLKSSTFFQMLSPALTIAGFMLGLAFYSANEGSKYWQVNWEKNLDRLEFYVSGDLYKIVAKLPFRKPSVSKVNLYVAKIVCSLWLVGFIWILSFCYFIIPQDEYKHLFLLLYIVISILLPLFFLHKIRDESREDQNIHEFSKRQY